MSVCVLLDENPKVRYYKPKNPIHEANVLCHHLSRFVQEELDEYAGFTPGFGEHSGRPQGVLIIVDRSMDLMAPLLHEFTYQAMAHDVLPIKDSDKVRFRMAINEGQRDQEEKYMELQETDKVWVDNRHRHMKDTIDKLMSDFQKFLDQNPQFAKKDDSQKANLNTIKDMLAGLPQFQTMKEAYSLHLTMAQKCMDAFQEHKLSDVASVEQTLATGLDEDSRKPKNVLDEVVRLLDDDAISPADRLRLIMIYIMYRDGVIVDDIKRLLAHSSLPPKDGEAVANLQLLGARMTRGLKETRPPPSSVFPRVIKSPSAADDVNVLSRYETVLKQMLDELCKGTLDQAIFPYTKDPVDPQEELLAAQGSLRAGRPNWAAAGRRPAENRPRVIIFMAGGATYSESRACYEASTRHGRDIVLVTSHMLTPQLFVRQLGDLSAEKRRLDLPMERPKPKPPTHLYERPTPPSAPTQAPVSAYGRGGPGFPAPPGGHRHLAAPHQVSRHVAPPPQGPVRSAVQRPPTGAMSQMSLDERPSSNGSTGSGGAPSDSKHDKSKRRNFLGIKR